MSDKGLKMWQDSINEYHTKNNTKYTVPHKGTQAYIEIKKIYEAKKNGKEPEKKLKKSCKCRCKCDCQK